MFPMRLLIVFVIAFEPSLWSSAGEGEWREITGRPELQFPRDHGAHPERPERPHPGVASQLPALEVARLDLHVDDARDAPAVATLAHDPTLGELER